MQILELSLVACVAAVAARPFLVLAQDSSAQTSAPHITSNPGGSPARLVVPPSASQEEIEKAREALHEKLRELQAQQNLDAQTSAPASPAVTAPAVNAPADEKRRLAAEKAAQKEAAARLKMQKAEEARAAAEEAKRRKAAEATAKAQAATEAKQRKADELAAQKSQASQSEVKTDLEKQHAAESKARKAAKAEAAMEAKAGAKAENKADVKTVAAPPEVKAAEPAFTPIAVPETGFSTAKTERLQKLLDDYKADRISAEDYHQLRAKALQEP